MKNILCKIGAILLIACISGTATAQSVNGGGYDRNSLTVIAAGHGDSYDSVTATYFAGSRPGGDKFDVNAIPVKSIRIPGARFVKTEDNSADTYMRLQASDVADKLKEADVARKIVTFWFNRRKNGDMDLSVINRRAEYNATDQTYYIAHSSALGDYLLKGDGPKLIQGSYVLVIDHAKPVRSDLKDSMTGKVNGVQYSVDGFGYLYKLNFGDEWLQKVYDCWIYSDDTPEERSRKLASWDEIPFSLSLEKIVLANSISSKTFQGNDREEKSVMEDAVRGCSSSLMRKLDKQVAAWQVKTAIYKLHPVSAKIGTKEGLKNMDRYKIIEYVSDGNSLKESVKGYVRASEVVNNSSNARGKSSVSEFYQIAGGRLEPGMELRQKNSADVNLKLLYYGGCGKLYGIEGDFMFGLKTNGSVNHVWLGAGYGRYGKGFTANDEKVLAVAVDAIDIRMGYGYGFRPMRFLELIPGLSLLAGDLSSELDKDDTSGSGGGTGTGGEEEQSSVFKSIGWGLEAGLNADISIWYPVKLTAGVYYDQYLFGGADWKIYKDALKEVGTSRSGLNFRAGLVYEF